MRILHVLSQTQPTGAETYALSLAEHQLRSGHQVWIVSDKLHFPTKAKYVAMPIHNRRYLQRLRNVKSLRSLIQQEKIDVVHAHSRASSWVSYYSCIGSPTAYLSTVHGRQHLHTSVKLHDIYGDRVLAVCENLRTHLAEEVAMDPQKFTSSPTAWTSPSSTKLGRKCLFLRALVSRSRSQAAPPAQKANARLSSSST